MDRQILLSDINSAFANIEISMRPELRDKAVIVAGSRELRHGIVLAASQPAKKTGIKAGMAIWQAQQRCGNLTVLPPNTRMYQAVTDEVRRIYSDYSDFRIDYSIDESWMDVTGCCPGNDAAAVADEIRERVKRELGITISIGVSWNMVYAKMASELKKPDGTTVVSRDNYKDIIWSLPVGNMFMVGRATGPKLRGMAITTIGDLASTDPEILHRKLGKYGYALWQMANGYDNTLVRHENYRRTEKTIGNSQTTARDMTCDEDVWITLTALCESVGMRLRESGFMCGLVEVSLRTTDLKWFSHQRKLGCRTDVTRDLLRTGFELYKEARTLPLRSIGVRAAELVPADTPEQLDLFTDYAKRKNLRAIDTAVDDIRRRFGYRSIQRGTIWLDEKLGAVNARTHTIHPQGFLGL